MVPCAPLAGVRFAPSVPGAVSSAVEHYLDMVGVTSSILVPPTNPSRGLAVPLRRNPHETGAQGRSRLASRSVPIDRRRGPHEAMGPVVGAPSPRRLTGRRKTARASRSRRSSATAGLLRPPATSRRARTHRHSAHDLGPALAVISATLRGVGPACARRASSRPAFLSRCSAVQAWAAIGATTRLPPFVAPAPLSAPRGGNARCTVR